MAEAKHNTEVVKVVEEESYTLTLTPEEAEIVFALVASTNGMGVDGAFPVYSALSAVLGRNESRYVVKTAYTRSDNTPVLAVYEQ